MRVVELDKKYKDKKILGSKIGGIEGAGSTSSLKEEASFGI